MLQIDVILTYLVRFFAYSIYCNQVGRTQLFFSKMIQKLVCPSFWAWVIWNFSILITLMCNMCFFHTFKYLSRLNSFATASSRFFFFGWNRIKSHCHRECSVELVSFSIKKFIDVFFPNIDFASSKCVYFHIQLAISNWLGNNIRKAISLYIDFSMEQFYCTDFIVKLSASCWANKYNYLELAESNYASIKVTLPNNVINWNWTLIGVKSLLNSVQMIQWLACIMCANKQ